MKIFPWELRFEIIRTNKMSVSLWQWQRHKFKKSPFNIFRLRMGVSSTEPPVNYLVLSDWFIFSTISKHKSPDTESFLKVLILHILLLLLETIKHLNRIANIETRESVLYVFWEGSQRCDQTLDDWNVWSRGQRRSDDEPCLYSGNEWSHHISTLGH